MDTMMPAGPQDGDGPIPDHSSNSTSKSSPFMSEQEQTDRRNSIREIMADGTLTEMEKRRSIQSLMDGRRRSSGATGTSSISSSRCAPAFSSSGNDSDSDDDSDDVDYNSSDHHLGGSPRFGATTSSNSQGGDASEYVNNMAAAAKAAAEYYSDDDMNMSDMEDDDNNNHSDGKREHLVFGGGPLSRQSSGAGTEGGDSNNCGSAGPGGGVPAQLECTLGYNRRGSLGYNRRASLVTGGINLDADDGGAGGDEHDDYDGPPQKQAREDLSRLDDDGDDNIPKRMRRYGRAMSLQDWSDGAFAATAAMASPFFGDDPQAVNKRMEKSRPNCDHYERQCTVVSPCCGLAFGCRICHDDCPVLPPPLAMRKQEQWLAGGEVVEEEAVTSASAALEAMEEIARKSKKMGERRRSMPIDLEEEETHHEIDRFAIREVICRKCYTRQSSKTNNCINCGIRFGEYHCDICNLWMSQKESPYHCRDCGFCRVGGRENFQHCDDCGMCIDALLFDDHNCKVGKYMSNCPVCQEDLFSSRYASHEMPCGHAIHWHCFKELTSYDTRCPVCKKTAETSDQMAATWSAMAMGIALQPVPADLARVVTILCYDCEERDENRRWHFLGVRCMNCFSFNTTVERTVMMGREAAAFLDDLDAHREDQNSGSEFGTAANFGQHGMAYDNNPPDYQQQLDEMNMDENMNSSDYQYGGGSGGSGAGRTHSGALNEDSMDEDRQRDLS